MKYAATANVKLFSDGTTYNVDQVAAFNRKRDICMLALSSSPCPPGPKGEEVPCSPPVRWPDTVAVGDDVFVLGTPQGLEGSLSKGIISGTRSAPRLLQFDAAVSPGSSGGPLLNAQGEVIGIVVSSMIGGQNLNFAIPIEDVLSLKFRPIGVRTAGGLAVFDREDDRLRGPVKEVTERSVSMDFNQVTRGYEEKPAVGEMVTSYDSDGNKTRITGKNLLTGVTTSACYFFGDDGLLKATSDCKTNDPSPEMTGHMFEVSPDDAPYHTGAHHFGGPVTEDSTGKLKWSFSATGYLDWMSIEGEKFYAKSLFTYDQTGRVAEERVVDKNGMLEWLRKSAYEVDEVGNWLVRTVSSYSATYPQLGYTPYSRTYRTIAYYER
jgi:hypothetical protein